jgi:hypothetical protein
MKDSKFEYNFAIANLKDFKFRKGVFVDIEQHITVKCLKIKCHFSKNEAFLFLINLFTCSFVRTDRSALSHSGNFLVKCLTVLAQTKSY